MIIVTTNSWEGGMKAGTDFQCDLDFLVEELLIAIECVPE